MESVASVMARISEIRALTAPPVAQAPVRTPAGASFADALAQARLATPTEDFMRPASGPAGGALRMSSASPVLQPAGGAASVQEIKAAWPNGRVPDAQLVAIGGGQSLAAPAASAFIELQQAARTAGIPLRVTDSYRSYDEQVDVAQRKGLYSQGGLAARPGTSQHGWGLAVDLALDPKSQAWMRANGPRFGFVEDVPREPWHWTFRDR